MEGIQEKLVPEPDALYDPLETARILGFRGKPEGAKNRIYEIPAKELPRTWVGPNGGKAMFRGRDILAYMDARRRDW